ncbi:unnamed protein product, partial [Trichogramma brassicae]
MEVPIRSVSKLYREFANTHILFGGGARGGRVYVCVYVYVAPRQCQNVSSYSEVCYALESSSSFCCAELPVTQRYIFLLLLLLLDRYSNRRLRKRSGARARRSSKEASAYVYRYVVIEDELFSKLAVHCRVHHYHYYLLLQRESVTNQTEKRVMCFCNVEYSNIIIMLSVLPNYCSRARNTPRCNSIHFGTAAALHKHTHIHTHDPRVHRLRKCAINGGSPLSPAAEKSISMLRLAKSIERTDETKKVKSNNPLCPAVAAAAVNVLTIKREPLLVLLSRNRTSIKCSCILIHTSKRLRLPSKIFISSCVRAFDGRTVSRQQHQQRYYTAVLCVMHLSQHVTTTACGVVVSASRVLALLSPPCNTYNVTVNNYITRTRSRTRRRSRRWNGYYTYNTTGYNTNSSEED